MKSVRVGSESSTAGSGRLKTKGDEGPGRPELFVARQPILDRQRRTYGYELLFRSGPQNAFSHTDGSQATRQTVNTTLNVMGLSRLVDDGKAFVNITRDLLLSEFYQVLPAKQTVVEILEDIEIDDEVVEACVRLKKAGYFLALDDFVFQPAARPLLAIADLVKVDLTLTSLSESRALIEAYKRPSLAFLAEKVETSEQFEQAVRLGYSYFQGYFFCRPEVVRDNDIPTSKEHCLMFLNEVTKTSMDYNALEQIVRMEPSLSVKLLRYINASSQGMSKRVSSIHQALALLGEKALRQWGALVAVTCLGDGKPTELMRVALMRARFCELIGEQLDAAYSEMDLFLMGLLSTLDAMLDRSMAEVLSSLPVAEHIKGALLGESTLLAKVHMLTLARERGQWQRVGVLAKLLRMNEAAVAEAYAAAIAWADETVAGRPAHA